MRRPLFLVDIDDLMTNKIYISVNDLEETMDLSCENCGAMSYTRRNGCFI